MNRKSLSEVAKELNVSATTLSFVLNGKGVEKRISAPVIEKIEKYIKETGYRPNFLGKSLRTGKSDTIGLIVGDLANPFFSEIASGIEKLAVNSGYSLIVASSNNNDALFKKSLDLLVSRNVDAMIIACPGESKSEIVRLKETKIPFILYDRFFPEIETFNVVVNNFDGAFQAAKHLYQQGFRNIGFVTLDLIHSSIIERNKGYAEFVESVGMRYVETKVKYGVDYDEISGSVYKFLTENEEVDALFFSTNILTIGGLMTVKEFKKNGRNLGVVSFDDHTLYNIFSPTVTAITQPIKGIVKAVMSNLLEMLNPEKRRIKKLETVVLPVSLVIRESSKKEIFSNLMV